MLTALHPRASRQDQRAAFAGRVERVQQHAGLAAGRDHDRNSRARGLPRGLELGRHPAAAQRARALGHETAHLGLGVGDQRNQPRVGTFARVAGEHAGHVGQDHQQVSLSERRDQRGKHVIVAEPDFLDRHGVVLVDDRNRARAEQGLDSLARVEAPFALGQVLMRQQDLRDYPIGRLCRSYAAKCFE